jgi:hypothetical protein
VKHGRWHAGSDAKAHRDDWLLVDRRGPDAPAHHPHGDLVLAKEPVLPGTRPSFVVVPAPKLSWWRRVLGQK